MIKIKKSETAVKDLKENCVYYNYEDDRIEFLNPQGMYMAGHGFVPMLDYGNAVYMTLCTNPESEITYPLEYIGEL